jgi:integrase
VELSAPVGIFTRPDSSWWWLYLETGRTKERTDIKIGKTTAQRHDSRLLAEQRYHQRMNEIAARVHRLPSARPAVRFDAYADVYARDVLPHHKGRERERELLKVLRAGFGSILLSALDREQVQRWMMTRRAVVSARTVNREIDLLKAMLRDAAPKYIDGSPLVGMKRLKVLTPKRRLLSPAEERKLLKASRDPQERALLILGVDALVRMGDLLDLKRTDRHGAWLYISDPKGDTPYEVALSPRACRALDAIRGSSPYYFERFRGATMTRDRRARVRRALMKLCLKAGVAYGKAKGGITFHWATRRTGATRLLVQRKVDVPTVQRLGNWKTADVLLQIYAESDRKAMRAAVRPFPVRSRSKRKSA